MSYHDYLPFGEEIPSGLGGRGSLYGAADGITHKFTSKERDATETGGSAMQGLDYFGARYYSSAQGRFTSPDEFKGGIVDPFTGKDIETNTALPYADITDPQTLNKYAYVRNNPLRYVDPNGHCIEDLCIGEALLVGAAATATANYLNSPQGQQSINATLNLVGTGLNTVASALGNLIFRKTPSGNTNAQPKQQEATTATPTGPEPPQQGGQEQKEGAQDKKLSNSEVKTLEKNTGQSAHDIKGDIVGDKGVSRYDLYKTKGGDIVVKPKSGSGTGEPTGYTTEHLKHLPEQQ